MHAACLHHMQPLKLLAAQVEPVVGPCTAGKPVASHALVASGTTYSLHAMHGIHRSQAQPLMAFKSNCVLASIMIWAVVLILCKENSALEQELRTCKPRQGAYL